MVRCNQRAGFVSLLAAYWKCDGLRQRWRRSKAPEITTVTSGTTFYYHVIMLSKFAGSLLAEAEGVAVGERLRPLIRWIGFRLRTDSTTGDSA